jgi:acetylornithine deacetylase/succinyl-diaminopimelate desuccinylase-like protein/gamma-glutamyl:cysteine ligase YbdK (ATP-grasp superfamily)
MGSNQQSVNWEKFTEKYRLALTSSLENHFDKGTSGIEAEFNVLDGRWQPLCYVGTGPEKASFADYFLSKKLPSWARPYFHLEVFHWMTELTTRPYYDPNGTVWEALVLQGVLIHVLESIALAFGERFYPFYGTLLYPIQVSGESIPRGWSLAKQNYLARCVTLFGSDLATTGIHTNHSLPDDLLSWDFFHLPLSQRRGKTLVHYRNEVNIRATRLLRPYCALFMAISAATPLASEPGDRQPLVVLTPCHSTRLLRFPNPERLDVPYLYASHADYIRISYDLVRNGIRFGANNWTPVRARSDVEPVNKNILITSSQLKELYRRGIYTQDKHVNLEEAEKALIIENLCARVDLPMGRVEVRTDEGWDDMEYLKVKILLKDLLMLRIYGDPRFGGGYRYDGEDIARARENERRAALDGMNAVITHPFTGRPISMRAFLKETLQDLKPLIDGLDCSEDLAPIFDLADGAPGPADRLRDWISKKLTSRKTTLLGNVIVPPEVLMEWVEERKRKLKKAIQKIFTDQHRLRGEREKFLELFVPFETHMAGDPIFPFRPHEELVIPSIYTEKDRVRDVLELAGKLIRIPSVTNSPRERREEVFRCARYLVGLLKQAGFGIKYYDDGDYPALLAHFPGRLHAAVTLSGHFDVVEPDPNDTQFIPRIEGDYLVGRGSADMKTVVATYAVWMLHMLAQGPPYPSVNVLLVGNEENGEREPWGTPHVLNDLKTYSGWEPELMIVGERTGEKGDELVGKVCTKNRGVMRLAIEVSGEKRHTGMGGRPVHLLDRLTALKSRLEACFKKFLRLDSLDGWHSAAHFPFLRAGTEGVYNVTADRGVLGVEIRPIPEENLGGLLEELDEICAQYEATVKREVMEAGVVCPGDNVYLNKLLQAVEHVSGRKALLGRKLAGTSARFARDGKAVVWGQSGVRPHSRHEKHFIPSIEPYLRILDALGGRML